jgi:hypothetical protein
MQIFDLDFTIILRQRPGSHRGHTKAIATYQSHTSAALARPFQRCMVVETCGTTRGLSIARFTRYSSGRNDFVGHYQLAAIPACAAARWRLCSEPWRDAHTGAYARPARRVDS